MTKDYLEIKKLTLKILIIAQVFSFFIFMIFYNPYSNYINDNNDYIFEHLIVSYCLISLVTNSACAIFFLYKSKHFKLKNINYLIFFNILVIIYNIIELLMITTNHYYPAIDDWRKLKFLLSLLPILFIPTFYKYLKYFNENISEQYKHIPFIIYAYIIKVFFEIILIVKSFDSLIAFAKIYTIYQFTDIICNSLYISFYDKLGEVIEITSDNTRG